MPDGGGEAGGKDAAEPVEQVVHEDARQHGGEEQGGVVVVDVEHPPHAPEGHIVKGPAQEEPCGGPQGSLPGLPLLHGLHPPPLLLEAGPGIDAQEQHQEHYVAPPDQRVAQEVDPGLVVASWR